MVCVHEVTHVCMSFVRMYACMYERVYVVPVSSVHVVGSMCGKAYPINTNEGTIEMAVNTVLARSRPEKLQV